MTYNQSFKCFHNFNCKLSYGGVEGKGYLWAQNSSVKGIRQHNTSGPKIKGAFTLTETDTETDKKWFVEVFMLHQDTDAIGSVVILSVFVSVSVFFYWALDTTPGQEWNL